MTIMITKISRHITALGIFVSVVGMMTAAAGGGLPTDGLASITDTIGPAVPLHEWEVTDTTKTDSRKWLPNELKDTTELYARWQARTRQDLSSRINVLSRTYGDSIVLRWAPDDYVTWRYLCQKGVDIYRYDVEANVMDTIAVALLPSTLEEFRAAYDETDSLAGMAMGALYNKKITRTDQTMEPAGTVPSIYEVHQDQQMTFGIAVLVSELRPDLANRLQMRFADKTAKRGRTYSYNIVPSVYDETGHVVIAAGLTENIKNEKYKPEPFDVEMGDSITPPNGVRIWWTRKDYSSYEIERRDNGSGEWKRLNQRPYVIMIPEQEDMDCFYSDNLEPGRYEYRILAHDPFGDLTEPSAVHTVVMKDMVPPRAPQLKHINIIRPHEDDPSKEIWADIYFEKDTVEEDFKAIDVLYYHERITEGKWMSLLGKDKLLSTQDTVCHVDVTNIPSCQVCVAAVDTAGNYGYSIPQLMRVSDMRPPMAPKGFAAETRIDSIDTDAPVGIVRLHWNAVESDDVDYYEILFANDTTHVFMVLNEGQLRDTCYTDTVALDVNQKYIYYKVRAVDYSTNIGESSPLLQVIRPSLVPPTQAHLDSSYVDGKGIFMRWIVGSDEQSAYHNVYRKLLESDKEWTLLRRCDGDSLRAVNYTIDVFDTPDVRSDEEYVYAVESFNYSGISSGLSLQYIVRYTGEPVFSIPMKLYGDYDNEAKMTKLVWEADNLPKGNDWYFCVWRMGPDDDRFKFLMSVASDEREFTDYLLRSGESAQYFIQVQMNDGRESEPSNIVTIKAPEKK